MYNFWLISTADRRGEDILDIAGRVGMSNGESHDSIEAKMVYWDTIMPPFNSRATRLSLDIDSVVELLVEFRYHNLPHFDVQLGL